MKPIKKIVSMILVIAIVASISVSAFAASPTQGVIDQFRNFQLIKQGHISTYVRIAQRFLLYYNSVTANYIRSNGGVDGSFGKGTYDATVAFQSSVFSNSADWDGIVGSNTWEQICRAMDFEDRSGEGTVYNFWLGKDLILWRVSNIWSVKGGDGVTYKIYI